MAMEETDEDNPFLAALKIRAPDLYQLASEKQLVVCCPQRGATAGLSLNRTCFETHILEASPFFAGVYKCLNSDRTVDLDDGVIKTQHGFFEHRRIKILHEDLHYNSDFKPFRVMIISQAFEGGSPVIVGRRRTSKEPELLGNTLEECRTLFLALDVKDVSPLAQRAPSFVRDFFLTYRIFPKGYLHIVSSKLNEVLDKAAEQLILANRSSLQDRGFGSKKWPVFRRVVCTVLLHDTRISVGGGGEGGLVVGSDCVSVSGHEKLLERVREAYREEDMLVQTAVKHKQHHTAAQLGASQDITCDLTEAVQTMRWLYTRPSALDKVTALRQVSRAVTSAIERAVADGTLPAHFTLGSDDLLPLFIYVVIQSAAPSAVADNASVSCFPPSARSSLLAPEAVLSAAKHTPKAGGPAGCGSRHEAGFEECGVYSTACLLQHFGVDPNDVNSAQNLFDIATFQAAADFLLREGAHLPRMEGGLARSGSPACVGAAAEGRWHDAARRRTSLSPEQLAKDMAHAMDLPGLPLNVQARHRHGPSVLPNSDDPLRCGDRGIRAQPAAPGPVLAKHVRKSTMRVDAGDETAGDGGVCMSGLERLSLKSPPDIIEGGATGALGDFLSSLRSDEGATLSGRAPTF